MSPPTSALEIAAAILSAWDKGVGLDRQAFAPPADLDEGQARQEAVNALRRARGEQPVGYKIGFTNRSIWPLYNVFHPIWAPVWNSTLTQLDKCSAEISLQHFAEPRLEPEIVLCMARTPAGSGPDAMFEAIDWIAHGLEIVQSPYPGWKFSAAEAVAAQSLHGALLVGPRKPRSIVVRWQDLGALQLALALNGRPVASGSGEQALGNPVLALAHLADELARQGRSLQAGDIVTTGTLTDAQPLSPGQCWTTSIAGCGLDGLELRTR
jgi:2-keto-4-pentenoate hydratase